MVINPPLIPPKSGFIAEWENYTLELADIEIFAIYTPVEDTNFTYALSSDKKSYILTGYEGNSKNLIVPQIHNNLPVSSVAANAFINSNIESIELSEGVATIQNSAFYNCNELVSIKLPETLETIEENAFTFCIKLETISFPKSLKTIKSNAFEGCPIAEIVFPGYVENIEPYAFYACINLKSVTFTLGIKYLKTDAFMDCRSLLRVYFGAGLRILYPQAFRNCLNITYMQYENKENLGIAETLNVYKKDLPASLFDNPIENAALYYSMCEYYLIYDYYNTVYEYYADNAA